ncbi:MAG: PTS sugar transporter subunit IIA [Lactobacillus sp.]|nr:PTS glucose transporter subunit IIA [Lactobacillus sp.]MDN6053281.1 PTS glucose transporter subunit IIA [Lactobacillus sp.]
MFNFLKRKNKSLTVKAAADGQLQAITEVNDDVFSTKMLGDGYAIVPTSGHIYAPIAGKITTVFPTKHAIGIRSDQGLEVLIHLGLDTVELKGLPFNSAVNEGQEVKAGDLLSVMDLSLLRAQGYDPTVIVVYTNMDLLNHLSELLPQTVQHLADVQILAFK